MSESIKLGVILANCRWIYGCLFLYVQRKSICQCTNRKYSASWNQYFREKLAYGTPLSGFRCWHLPLESPIADLVKNTDGKNLTLLHWRQISVFCEAVILLSVSFIPQDFNLVANALTSLACGIQVESFRKIHGNGIATTMCIGNLRSATQHMCSYANTKDKEYIKKGLLYYGIIFFFVIGAVIGNACVEMFAEKALLIASAILAVAFVMMFVDGEKEQCK